MYVTYNTGTGAVSAISDDAGHVDGSHANFPVNNNYRLSSLFVSGAWPQRLLRLGSLTGEVVALEHTGVRPGIAPDYLAGAIQWAPSMATGGSLALVANRQYAVPYLPRRTRLATALVVNVTTADAGNPGIRLGVYSDSGLMLPAAGAVSVGVADAGSVSAAATGFKVLSNLQILLLADQLYWLSLISQGAPQVWQANGAIDNNILGADVVTGAQNNGYFKSGAGYGVLAPIFPATPTLSNGNSAGQPAIGVIY